MLILYFLYDIISVWYLPKLRQIRSEAILWCSIVAVGVTFTRLFFDFRIVYYLDFVVVICLILSSFIFIKQEKLAIKKSTLLFFLLVSGGASLFLIYFYPQEKMFIMSLTQIQR